MEKKQREMGRDPFDLELRARLIAHVKKRYAAGESVGKIVRSLGLSEQTVWSGKSGGRQKAKGLKVTLQALVFLWFDPSGRRDSNSRPLVPQTSALTRLRYAPDPSRGGARKVRGI